MTVDLTWEEALQEILCLIYEAVGGNCDDLDWEGDGQAALDGLEIQYQAHRTVGGFNTQTEVDAFRGLLIDLQKHLLQPANDIGDEMTTNLLSFTVEALEDLESDGTASRTRSALPAALVSIGAALSIAAVAALDMDGALLAGIAQSVMVVGLMRPGR